MKSEIIEKIIILNKKSVNIIKHPKINDDVLRRHYVLDSDSLKDIELFESIKRLNLANTININILVSKKTVKAIFLLLNRISDIQFLVPPIEFDLLSPINLYLLFQYKMVFKDMINPLFFKGDVLPFSDFDSSMDNVESTNFHYILHYKTGEKIRFKKYTRFTLAQTREAVMARILSEKGFYPKFYSLLGINWDNLAIDITKPFQYSPLGIFIENLENYKNVESVFATLYLLALRYPNRRSIGTIKTFQKELISIIEFLTQFEGALNDISKMKDLYNILGEPKEGFYQWKQNFVIKYKRIKEQIEIPDLNFNDITNDYQIIHGDCWLRQFVKLENKVILLDLEDVTFGHQLFDLASLTNSLEQQNDYFREVIAKENDEINWIQDLKFSFMNFILEKIPKQLLKTFVLLRIMRMVHELDYILHYQPYLTWQISIIIERIRDLANKIKDKDLEYLELLTIK